MYTHISKARSNWLRFRTLSSACIDGGWSHLDRAMMARAINLAKRCKESGDVPVGAVVVCNETCSILGEGWNQRERSQTPSSHAEMLAFSEASSSRGRWRLDKTTLYVTLEPCIMCYGAAVLARCEKIVYGTPNTNCGATTSGVLADTEKLNHTPHVVGGLMSGECSALLQDFFKSIRTKKSG